ncbi:MAG: hypothetical protein H6759_01195 [Candidatus Nomurabacteria bacterium]|nr:MAG: hypothetical protein H6759_01195 [Candidatus Nomurabacteria bacterium]
MSLYNERLSEIGSVLNKHKLLDKSQKLDPKKVKVTATKEGAERSPVPYEILRLVRHKLELKIIVFSDETTAVFVRPTYEDKIVLGLIATSNNEGWTLHVEQNPFVVVTNMSKIIDQVKKSSPIDNKYTLTEGLRALDRLCAAYKN